MSESTQPTVWVLVADGAHARVVTPEAHEGRFVTVPEFQAPHVHTAGAVSQDPHAESKLHFAQDVAKRLDAASASGAFDQLVLVAPAHTLHDIRAALGHETAAKVVGTVGKDYVSMNDHEVSAHLVQWWLMPAA